MIANFITEKPTVHGSVGFSVFLYCIPYTFLVNIMMFIGNEKRSSIEYLFMMMLVKHWHPLVQQGMLLNTLSSLIIFL